MILNHETYKGYRAHLEHGVVVWCRETIKHVVGYHPDNGKPIKIAKSGFKDTMMRVPTNTDDLEKAKKMLDNKLKRPDKTNKYQPDPAQGNLF